jgi:hypothetical protein
VNSYLYAILALDIASERSREAQELWLARSLTVDGPTRTARARRVVARALASVSLGSATVARKLDSCVADDLGRTLAPAE